MPTLQEILQDQNYINANPATKKAIFDRWSASDTNYTGANPATKQAIRSRFGVGEVEVAAVEPPKDKGFFSNVGSLLVEGGKRAIGAAQVSPSVIAGDVGEDKAKVLSEQLSMKPSVQPKELVEAQTAFKDEAEAFEKAKGFTESIGPFGAFLVEFGKQVVTNPKGAVYLTASSAANMAPQIAGMIAGGKGGMLLGPKGAAVGAIGGGFAAGVPLEIGAEFIGRIGEELQKRGLEPTEENVTALLRDKKAVEQAISDARTKGTTTAAVDSLMTVGAGKFATGARRSAIDNARKELGEAASATQIAKRADELLKARTLTQKVGRGAGAVGIETAGGGISEAAGQLAAYGEVDLEDVGAEMLGELGGSAVSIPAAAYSLGKDKLKEQARGEADRILAEEEKAKAPPVALGAEGTTTPAVQEPTPEPYVKPPSISGTRPDDLLGEREDPLAGVVAKRRAQTEPASEIPLGDDYAFLQREKQRLLQVEQTPETKKLLGRINDQLGVVLQRDIERLRTESETLKRNREADAEATKTSVFGQEELPPVESRDVVVGNIELGELQAREAPPVDPLTGREAKRVGEMEGTPQPMIPEVEAEVEKLTKDQELAIAERDRMEKRTSGTSLSQVLRGTLRDAELSELGGRARQVGKNPFLNLKAPKGQAGSSMEDMVDTGKLNIFLPVKMRPDSPDYVNSESAEYIRDKLRNNQLYTYETELAIQRVENDIESIERQIQDLLTDDEINKELQYAADEQRGLDQDAQEPAAPEADRAPEQRQAKASDDDLDKRQAQLDREEELNQREARLLEERKRLEAERLELERPTKEDVKQQEERKGKAPELDEREQVRKESEAGAGQFELTREEGRQDTTGGLFEQSAAEPVTEPVAEPVAEPAPVAVSTEAERKTALSQLKKSLSTAIAPFRSRGGDNRVSVIKPTPLSRPLMSEVLKLASDALDLGLPPAVLGDVKKAGSTRSEAIAMMTNSGWLMIGKQWKNQSDAVKLLGFIHELGHALDANANDISGGPKWDKAHNELQQWYRSSADKSKHPLAYPFAPQYRKQVRIKAESFAQAFGYYFTSPVDLQKNAPEAYSQIQSIVERIQDGSQAARAAGTTETGTAGIKVQPTRATRGAAVQPDTREVGTDVGATERLQDRGAGEVIEEQQTNATRQNIFGEPVLGTWSITPDPKMELQDGLIYKLLDKNIDVKRIVEAVKKTGKEIASQWNPYLQEELYHGRTANAALEFQDKEWLPLLKDMEAKNVTIGELEKYLHNRHAEDYNKLVAKRNPNRPEMQDGGSNIATADARKYLADLDPETKAKYDELAARVDGITKGTRQLLADTGYEKAERIEAWEKAFPNYVPLMREEGDFDYNFGSFGTGRGFDVRRDFSRSAMGSKRNVVDIIGNVIAARNNAIALTEKNRVAQAVYGLALEAPNPDFWMAINPEAEKVPEDAIDELRAMGLDEEAAEYLMKEPKQRVLDPKRDQIVSRINTKLRENDFVLATRIDGEKRYVFFNPKDPRAKRAATALKNLDAQDLGTALGMIAKVTRWMASVNTQYNPIFGPYNFLRDVQSAALQLSTTELAGQQKEVAANVVPSLKVIYSSLRKRRKGEAATGDLADLWKEFQKEGGQTGFRDNFSRTQDRTEALLNEMSKITEGKAKAGARAVFDWLSDYNDSLENAVRLSAYKVAKEKFKKEGFSDSEVKQKAASLAKNLTVNFNRKGDIATQMGALYAFFNAAMQGTARMIETLKGPTGKKIMAGGLLLGSMQAALMAAAGFDDEEPPEFVRSKNIVIPTGDGNYIAFPMPLGFHVIPGVSRILTEWTLSGFDDTARRVTDLTGLFLDAFNPVGNAGWSVQTVTPTFLDPFVALGENRDWTGKPISKEDIFSLRPTPGYTRAREGANWLSTNLAEFLNYASGGTKYQPGVLSPTPEQIEYLFGQATGGVGREFVKLTTSIDKTITGEDLPPYKIPLYGRFVGETKSSAAESNKFYKNMEKLNRLDLEVKGRREDREPIGDFMRENPETRLLPLANKTYKDVQALRKRRAALLERDAPRESIQAVERMITRKMQVLNDRVKAMEQ